MFLVPLCSSLGLTKALWEVSAASAVCVCVCPVLRGEATNQGRAVTGEAELRSGPGGGELKLWVFVRAVLSSPPRPCPSSRAAQGMTGTISSFYFWQKLQEGSSPSLFVLILLFS